MEHGFHGALYFNVARDILMGESKSRVWNQVRNVGFVSGYKIIETQYIPAFFEHELAEMRT
jgi:hypothetical protein